MKKCQYLHPQAFDPARGMSRLLLQSGAPIEAAVQAEAKHTQKKPSRLKGPQKEPAQTFLSEGTWPSFIGRRRLSCNTDLTQQLPRWPSMTSARKPQLKPLNTLHTLQGSPERLVCVLQILRPSSSTFVLTNSVRAILDYIMHKLMFLTYLHPTIFTGCLFHSLDEP